MTVRWLCAQWSGGSPVPGGLGKAMSPRGWCWQQQFSCSIWGSCHLDWINIQQLVQEPVWGLRNMVYPHWFFLYSKIPTDFAEVTLTLQDFPLCWTISKSSNSLLSVQALLSFPPKPYSHHSLYYFQNKIIKTQDCLYPEKNFEQKSVLSFRESHK